MKRAASGARSFPLISSGTTSGGLLPRYTRAQIWSLGHWDRALRAGEARPWDLGRAFPQLCSPSSPQLPAGETGANQERRPRVRPARSASGADTELVAALKRRRLAAARQAAGPAFRVLHDRTLLAIAATRPRDEAALLAVPGFGPGLLKRYGKTLLALCKLAQSPARASFPSSLGRE